MTDLKRRSRANRERGLTATVTATSLVDGNVGRWRDQGRSFRLTLQLRFFVIADRVEIGSGKRLNVRNLAHRS